jgi:hypothetical protein
VWQQPRTKVRVRQAMHGDHTRSLQMLCLQHQSPISCPNMQCVWRVPGCSRGACQVIIWCSSVNEGLLGTSVADALSSSLLIRESFT